MAVYQNIVSYLWGIEMWVMLYGQLLFYFCYLNTTPFLWIAQH